MLQLSLIRRPRRSGDLEDYTGEVRARIDLRLTDKRQHAVRFDPRYGRRQPYTFTPPAPRPRARRGRDSARLTTSADALLFGMGKEGRRAIWQLGQIQVFDGGADGDASTGPTPCSRTAAFSSRSRRGREGPAPTRRMSCNSAFRCGVMHYIKMDLERAHKIARERGPVMPVYWVVRRSCSRSSTSTSGCAGSASSTSRTTGRCSLAANHRSFSDPFLIGCCLGRPLHFVAKIELFDKRWKAWILLALGAFPIRRGESDEDAMETARVILERGGAVGIFPEGTRVRPGPLGEPKRGVGRLVLETGAPVVPVAILGTEDIRQGWRDPPAARDRALRPRAHLPPSRSTASRGRTAAQEISNRVWSCISLAVGVAGRPPADPPSGRGRGRQLGHRRRDTAGALGRHGPARMPHERAGPAAVAPRASTRPTCPASSSPRTCRSLTTDELRWDEVDWCAWPCPSPALRDALDALRDRIPDGPRRAGAVQGPDRSAGERLPSRSCATPRARGRSRASAARRTPARRCAAGRT